MHLRLLLLYALLIHFCLPTASAQFPDLTFNQVVHDADLIFVGTAADEHSYLSKSGSMIYTDVHFHELKIIHVSKDANQIPKDVISITYPGGKVGDFAIAVTETPSFTKGQRYVLAMHESATVILNPVVGGPQGQFLVVTDPTTGQELILTVGGHAVAAIKDQNLVISANPFAETHQSTSPTDLHDTKTGARLRTLGGPTSTKPPLTLDAFIQEIEHALATPIPPLSAHFKAGLSYTLSPDGSYKSTPLPLTDVETATAKATALKTRTQGNHSTQPVSAGETPSSQTQNDGSDIYLCSRFRNLPITMELQPESSLYHDEDPTALAYFNDFGDMFRTRPGNRTAGFNDKNEFAAWISDAGMRHAYDFSWFDDVDGEYDFGPAAVAVSRTDGNGSCPRLEESDIVFNPNYAWTPNQDASEQSYWDVHETEDPNRRLLYYHTIVMHELGHVVGLMTGGRDETYDYNMPSIMQSPVSPQIEAGHGLHAEDIRLIRHHFDHEPFHDVIDIGVEAYAPEAGFNPASIYDMATDDPVCEWYRLDEACTIPSGSALWLKRITVENMSTFGSHDVLLSAYLSPTPGALPTDGLLGDPILLGALETHIAVETFRTYEFGLIVPNDVWGDYYLVLTAEPLAGVDINPKNNIINVLMTPITITTPVISGRVMRTTNSGLAEVSLVGFPSNVVTDAWGRYSVPVPFQWSGTVSIEEGLNYEFTPESATFANVIADATQDFQVRDPQISGHVLTAEGEPIAGVSILGFPQPVFTDVDGHYTTSVPRQWHGSVSLEKEGYTFDPSQTTYGFRYTDEVTDYVGTAAFLYTPEPLGVEGLHTPTIAWADFDNDGDLDFAHMGSTADPRIQLHIYRQVAPFQFENIDPHNGLDLPHASASALAWGDFDADGDLDLVITRSNHPESGTQILRNDGRGMDSVAWIFSVTPLTTPFSLGMQHGAQWGDYDNDGDLDLALAGSFRIRVYRNDGGEQDALWTFTELFTTTSSPFPSLTNGIVEWGDYDRDGDLDLLLTGKTVGRGDDIAHLYRNDGTANANDAWTFTDVFGEDAPWNDYTTLQQPHWGDFDNDGYLDVFFRSTDAARSPIFRSNRGQSFSEALTLPGVSTGYSAVGDFDNDGSLDILLGGAEGGYVYKNHGFRFFEPEVSDQERFLALRWGHAAPADINGDGRLDIVMGGTNNSNPVATLYRNHTAVAGEPPAQPETIQGVSRNGSIGFVWDVPTDPKLKSDAAYNLHVYHRMTSIGTVLPSDSQTGGYRQIVRTGNVNHSHFWRLSTDTWGWICARVQAVSHAFIGSSFSEEGCVFRADREWIPDATPRVAFDAAEYGRVDLTLRPGTKPGNLSVTFIPQEAENLPEGLKPQGHGQWVLEGYAKKSKRANLLLTLSDKVVGITPDRLYLMQYRTTKKGWQLIAADVTKDAKTGRFQLHAKDIIPKGTFTVIEGPDKALGKHNPSPSNLHAQAPSTFALEGAYPNPFNPTTQIRYSLPEVSAVRLQVFDLMGRTVATLIDGTQQAGHYAATFNATDLASGTYLYRLEAGRFAQVGKMVLMK